MANQLPKRQCVAVAELRKHGYTDLNQWINTPGNVLATRRGRIFIDKVIFHYPESEWANPFKVEFEDQRLIVLHQYEVYLRQLLETSRERSPEILNRFRALKNAKEIGCFCKPNERCHVEVILYYLDWINKLCL